MKLPELDLDVKAPDAFAVLAGMMVLQVGAQMSFAREPSAIWGVASIYVFASAILLVFAGLTDIDVRRWGRPLAGLAFLSLMVGTLLIYLMVHGTTIQTDTLAFTQQGAEALLAGQSPYAPTLTLDGAWPTPLLENGYVSQYSYPIGSALFVAPFAMLAEDGGRLAVVLATAAGGAALLYHSPNWLAPLSLIGLLVGDFATWGIQDLTDPLWVAPLIGALLVWPWSRTGTDSLLWSGGLFGVAMAMKQQPWFCAPFLFIWVWRERSLRRALWFAGVVAAVFSALHIPSLLLAPEATIRGVFLPIIGVDGTMVNLGVGLAALTLSGAFPLPNDFYAALMAIAGVALLVWFWVDFERVRWLAWVAWVPILFFNYRSLANYFVVLAPIAVTILVCRADGDVLPPGGDDVAAS